MPRVMVLLARSSNNMCHRVSSRWRMSVKRRGELLNIVTKVPLYDTFLESLDLVEHNGDRMTKSGPVRGRKVS